MGSRKHPGWAVGAGLIIKQAADRPDPGTAARWIALGLLVAVPLGVAAGYLLGASIFIDYAMPLVTVGVQMLLLIGVVRLRFYDIDVRVSRAGRIGGVEW